MFNLTHPAVSTEEVSIAIIKKISNKVMYLSFPSRYQFTLNVTMQ